ncbi:hypothetical protein [Roseibium salinum]|uniref:Uncharacterized protein n=1 Tax=Roseibium salinum TaxID=1604349 RepID=A0ABT3QWI7_9HYPH|nr:hypothetical protein [Roseibium sp. DSM 29163]MCX2721305.1 hypothetical protein [Roseibium sp. DSM 29163]
MTAMGILDLPGPVFTWLDQWLSLLLPPVASIAFWGFLCAMASMELYRLLSPQAVIAKLKVALKQSQTQLNSFDGEFADAWPLIRRMLSLALRRIALVFPATIAASLPILLIVVWLDSRHGAAYPPQGTPVQIEVAGGFNGYWTDNAGDRTPGAQIIDQGGQEIATIPLARPVPEVHKRYWWDMLIGNPAGYLADELPFDRVQFNLPRPEVVPVGPSWMRGWDLIFFVVLLLSAIILKFVRRIE